MSRFPPLDRCAAAPPSRYRYSKRRWRLLFGALDALAAPFVRDRAAPRSLSDPAAILLVQLDHLGDAVLSTALLRPLARRFPSAALDVLASPWNAEFWAAHPAVRRVHVAARSWLGRMGPGRSAPLEALRLGRMLRPFHYDLGIDARGDFFVALTMRIAKIPRRLGWSCGGGGFLLTDRPPWIPGRHEVLARLALLEALGILDARAELDVRPCAAARRTVSKLLAEKRLPRPWIALHGGAGTPAKTWPADAWAAVAAQLAEARGCSILLVGGASERALARRIEALAGTSRLHNLAGRLGVMELAALLERADVFLGADSGPAHLAAAVRTPAIVLMSGTNRAEQWRPWSNDCQVLAAAVACRPCHAKVCLLPDHPCMTGIAPDRVVRATLAALRRSEIPLERSWTRETSNSFVRA